jgi:hypothetical protein
MADSAIDFQPVDEQIDFQAVSGAAPARPDLALKPPPIAGSGVVPARVPLVGDEVSSELARQPAKPLEIGQRFNLQNPPEAAERYVSGVEGYPQIAAGAKQVAENIRPPAAVTPETQSGMVKGGLELSRGAMTAATPVIIAGGLMGPVSTVRGLAEAWLASKVGSGAAKKMGASPELQELTGNVAALGVGGRRILADSLGLKGSLFVDPEVTAATGEVMGGKIGVAKTPEGVTVAGKAGPFSFRKTFGGKPAESPAIEPQTIRGEPGAVGPPVDFQEVSPEGRPVVHDSTDATEIRTSAKDQHPKFVQSLEKVADQVPGARVVDPGVKPAESVDRKQDLGKPAETNADFLRGQIVTPDEASKKQAEQIIASNPATKSVEKIQNENLPITQTVVGTGKPGDANRAAEIQVATEAEHQAQAATHDLYAKIQDAKAAGKTAGAEKLQGQLDEKLADAAKGQAAGETQQPTPGKTPPPTAPTGVVQGDTAALPAESTPRAAQETASQQQSTTPSVGSRGTYNGRPGAITAIQAPGKDFGTTSVQFDGDQKPTEIRNGVFGKKWQGAAAPKGGEGQWLALSNGIQSEAKLLSPESHVARTDEEVRADLRHAIGTLAGDRATLAEKDRAADIAFARYKELPRVNADENITKLFEHNGQINQLAHDIVKQRRWNQFAGKGLFAKEESTRQTIQGEKGAVGNPERELPAALQAKGQLETVAPKGGEGQAFSGDVYHHSSSGSFEQYDFGKAGTHTDEGLLGHGAYFSTDPQIGKRLELPGETVKANVNLSNPLRVEYPKWGSDKSALVNKALGTEGLKGKPLTEALAKQGYDGVVLDYSPVGYKHSEVLALNPDQVKIKSPAALQAKGEPAASALQQQIASKDYGPGVEMVPISELDKIKEFDREANPATGFRDPGHLDALTKDLKENGIREPLSIIYNAETKHAVLGSGNHRLAAAKRLGLTALPVKVTTTGVGSMRSGAKVSGHTGELREGLKPSEIGIGAASPETGTPQKQPETGTAPEGITSAIDGSDSPPKPGAIAFDLDNSLAEYKQGDAAKDPNKIGAPIPENVAQAKQMLADGKDVWIYSARAASPETVSAIKAWTKEHLGKELPVTNLKHSGFKEFYDDRSRLLASQGGTNNDEQRIGGELSNAQPPESERTSAVQAGQQGAEGAAAAQRGGQGAKRAQGEKEVAKQPWELRQDKIKADVKASKAAGNQHVDQLPYGVEAMRGVHFKSLRDGTGGTVTTVGTDDLVRYQGDDKKDGIVPREETAEWVVDGRRNVRFDRKNDKYIVAGGGQPGPGTSEYEALKKRLAALEKKAKPVEKAVPTAKELKASLAKAQPVASEQAAVAPGTAEGVDASKDNATLYAEGREIETVRHKGDANSLGRNLAGAARILEARGIKPQEKYIAAADKMQAEYGNNPGPLYLELNSILPNAFNHGDLSLKEAVDFAQDALPKSDGRDFDYSFEEMQKSHLPYEWNKDNADPAMLQKQLERKEYSTNQFDNVGGNIQRAKDNAAATRRKAYVVESMGGDVAKVEDARKRAQQYDDIAAKYQEIAQGRIDYLKQKDADEAAAEERMPVTRGEQVKPLSELHIKPKEAWQPNVSRWSRTGKWISDGHSMIDTAALDKAGMKSLSRFLPSEANKAQSFDPAGILKWEKDAKKAGEFLGYIHREQMGKSNIPDAAYIGAKDGTTVPINAHILKLVMNALGKDVTIKVGDSKSAVFFYKGGKVAAVAMPFSSDGEIDHATARETLKNYDTAQSGTPVENQGGGTTPALGEESGELNINIGAIRDYLKTKHAQIRQAKDIDDGIFRLQKHNEAKQLAAVHLMKEAKGAPEDWEALYHNREDPSEPLTTEQEKLKAQYLDPIQARNQELYQELTPDAGADPFHVHRVVENSGSWLDRMLSTVKRGGGGNVLSKSAASLKHRSMMALEPDGGGDRQVVAIKGGRVIGFDGGQPQDLGGLRNGLTTKWELLDDRLSPIADKIIDLNQQIKDIPQEDRASQIEKLDAQVAKLEHDRDLLETVKGRAEGGMSPSATSVPVRGIEITFGKRAALTKKIDALNAEREKLEGATGVDGMSTVGTKKLEKRVSDLEKLKDERGQILATVPPSRMADSAWIGKDGKQWRITQATTKEIEANTNLKYHHNALASDISENLELERAHSAIEYLEALKASPEFANFAIKDTGRMNQPEGYRKSDLMQLHDYFFENHVADSLDRLHKDLKRGDMSALEKLGHFLTTTIFMNPLLHVPNIAGHWMVEKGGVGFGSLRMLGAVGRSSMAKAYRAVMTQNEDYMQALEQGVPLQSHRQDLRDMQKLIFDAMGKHLEDAGPSLSKALGYANPVELVKAWYKLSGKITWVTNDIATMQSMYEKMERGMSMDDAITETTKHIPDYKIPTHVMGSAYVSKMMRNPLISMFMAYHYGAMRSYGEAMKSATGLNERPAGGEEGRGADKRHGWDVLATIGVFLLGYHAVQQGLKVLMKDKRAHLRAAGPLTIPENIYEVARGEKQPTQALESTFTPSVLPKNALETYFNRDMYTGRPVYDTNRGVGNAAFQIFRHSAGAIAPVDQGLRNFESKKSAHNPLWNVAGISFPKTANQRKHDKALTKDFDYYRRRFGR